MSAHASSGVGAAAGSRAQPFYCPYCGETDLRPDEQHGSYRCEICDRVFVLRYVGLAGSA